MGEYGHGAVYAILVSNIYYFGYLDGNWMDATAHLNAIKHLKEYINVQVMSSHIFNLKNLRE